MRLWSVHPRYLDAKGLVAGWREALLAQKVLRGETTGYRNHPQLERFREASDPLAAIAAFLTGLADEADARGYRFDKTKIGPLDRHPDALTVAQGQIDYEADFLTTKLEARAPDRVEALAQDIRSRKVRLHPLFTAVPGAIAPWEKVRSDS